MARESTLNLLLALLFTLASSILIWIYLGPSTLKEVPITPVVAPRYAPLPEDAHRQFKARIARRLIELGVSTEAIGENQRMILPLNAGPWPVDYVAIYPDEKMAPKRLFHLLEYMDIPGAKWDFYPQDDLTVHIEARLNGMPSLLLHLFPVVKAPKPNLLAPPPEFNLLITGLGDDFPDEGQALTEAQGLSLAILPHSAYALEWAEQGKIHGLEIFLDFKPPADVDARLLRQNLGAVPYLRGVWLTHWPRPAGQKHRWPPAMLFEMLNENNLALAASGPHLAERAALLAPVGGQIYDINGPVAHIERQLERLLALASRDGAAAGALEVGDWHPYGLKSWIDGAKKRGYRPVRTTSALYAQNH